MSMLHAETYESVTNSVLLEFGREIRFLKALVGRLETRWLECCPRMQDLPPLTEQQATSAAAAAAAMSPGLWQGQPSPASGSSQGAGLKFVPPGPVPRQNRGASAQQAPPASSARAGNHGYAGGQRNPGLQQGTEVPPDMEGLMEPGAMPGDVNFTGDALQQIQRLLQQKGLFPDGGANAGVHYDPHGTGGGGGPAFHQQRREHEGWEEPEDQGQWAGGGGGGGRGQMSQFAMQQTQASRAPMYSGGGTGPTYVQPEYPPDYIYEEDLDLPPGLPVYPPHDLA